MKLKQLKEGPDGMYMHPFIKSALEDLSATIDHVLKQRSGVVISDGNIRSIKEHCSWVLKAIQKYNNVM